MNNETQAGTQARNSSSDTIDLSLRKPREMNSPESVFSTSEQTLRSVVERIEQATDPILKQVEESCALLASRDELEPAGDSEASGLRRDNTSAIPSSNRHDTEVCPVPFIRDWYILGYT